VQQRDLKRWKETGYTRPDIRARAPSAAGRGLGGGGGGGGERDNPADIAARYSYAVLKRDAGLQLSARTRMRARGACVEN